VTGGGLLIEPKQATLNIIANDFPVTISPSVVYVNEGQTAYFDVRLQKVFSSDVTITIATISGTALQSLDFEGTGDVNVTVNAGQVSVPFTGQFF